YLWKENNNYIYSTFLTLFLTVILYANSLNLPLKFISLLFVVSTLLIVFLPKKLEVATIIFILVFGTLSAIISPINDIPDEYVHYSRTVYISEGDINLTNNNKKLRISKDVDKLIKQSGKTFITSNLKATKHSTREYSYPYIKGTNAYYSFSYIPQALGILVGNALDLPILLTYYFGRLCNLISYAMLAFIAIKLSGSFKQVIAVVTLLPMNIYLAASFNQDGFAIGLVLVTIGLFINLLSSKDKSNYNTKFFLYLVLCGLLVLSKFTYFLLVCLPLFIPNEKFGKNTKLVILKKLGGLLLIFLFAAMWFRLYGQVKTPYVADFLKEVNVSQQVKNMLESPIVYSSIIIRHMVINLINMNNIFQFGALSYGITNLFPLYVCFFFFVYISNASKITINIVEKMGIIFVISAIIGATVLAMYLTWTPVGSSTVLGVQSRYLIGIIPLVLLLFSSQQQKFKQIEDILSDKLAIHVSLLFILAMLMSTIFRYYH
ncbi:TPA: DUF2142 domain-containing protein, partial [Streptococcus pyogenes]